MQTPNPETVRDFSGYSPSPLVSDNKLYVSGIRSGKKRRCDNETKWRVAIGKATMD